MGTCNHDASFVIEQGGRQWCLACEYEERETPRLRRERDEAREQVKDLFDACQDLKAQLAAALERAEKAEAKCRDWFDARIDEAQTAYYRGYREALERKPAKQPYVNGKNNYSYQHGHDTGTQDIQRMERAEAEVERLSKATHNWESLHDRRTKELNTATAEVERLNMENDRFKNAHVFLMVLGYRLCDIPACNCDSYHDARESDAPR